MSNYSSLTSEIYKILKEPYEDATTASRIEFLSNMIEKGYIDATTARSLLYKDWELKSKRCNKAPDWL